MPFYYTPRLGLNGTVCFFVCSVTLLIVHHETNRLEIKLCWGHLGQVKQLSTVVQVRLCHEQRLGQFDSVES